LTPTVQSEGTRSFAALAINTCVIDGSDHPYDGNSELELTLAIGHLFRDVAQPVAPCGICRQIIREFCALKMPILLVPAGYESANGNDAPDLLETSLEELLPHSFGPEDLELPRTG
jgi:cytidine deaminase